MKTREMNKIPFPLCSKDCEVIKILGAGECENVCLEKFKEPKKEGGE